jgi:thiol-disulfide isomerase/thioredoxin
VPTIWIIVFILQWIVLVFLICIMAGVLRYLGSIQDKIEEVIPRSSRFVRGEYATEFSLPDLSGHVIASKSLLKKEQELLLLFLSTKCDSCQALLGTLAHLVSTYQNVTIKHSIALVVAGELDSVANMAQKYLRQLECIHILVDQAGIVIQNYGISGTPFGIVLNSHGRVMRQMLGPTLNWLELVLGIHATSLAEDEEKEKSQNTISTQFTAGI